MADLETTLQALRAADAAGDTEGAARLSEIARSFQSTAGGAAVGNPNLLRQGDKALRPDQTAGEALATIGGAGVLGGVMGAAAPEILSGLGMASKAASPVLPGGAIIGQGLDFLGKAAKSVGRPIAAISGAISGASGETAGQLSESAGASKPVAELARFVGGGISSESAYWAKEFAKNVWARVPKLSVMGQAEKAMFKTVMEKLNDGVPQSLNKQEQEFIEKQVNLIRGGEKTDAPLENIGSIMGAEGQRLLSQSELQTANALRQAGTVGRPTGYPGTDRTMADVGGELQGTILKRNEKAIADRTTQYKLTEEARDDAVKQKEAAGIFPKDMPEFAKIIQSLEQEVAPGRRSPDVAKGFNNILAAIKTKTQPAGNLTERQKLGYDPVPEPQQSPAFFQAIDDERRKLGETFRGKPPAGYEGIDAATARKYYGMLSNLQKQYAGPSHVKLLDDYAAATPGLEVFSSKLGKKVTALDQYHEGQYPDPSAIPAAFFKTRASIKALHELVGNQTQVHAAALEFANHELSGKDAPAVRAWMSKNAEWLSEAGVTRSLVDKYATRLEGAERSMRNAQEFAKQAAADNSMLTRQSLPAQRAVDLIKSGDTEFWSKITPVIVQSQQAKTQLVSAARQVVADQATNKATSDFFNRNLRPFLEQSGIATTAEMDAVAKGLADIQAKNIPEPAKLAAAKRMVLNSFGGYAAGLGSRATVGGYGLLSDLIPQ